MAVDIRRLLVVKLADLGDVLICEPALRSLRAAHPQAQIDLLVPPTSVGIAGLLGHATTVITFPKYVFDDISAFTSPANLVVAGRFARQLRSSHYDAVIILHHLTTPTGAAKFHALSLAAGAPIVAGLDNGRGSFLTHRVTDRGFGAMHEAEYMLEIARVVGGSSSDPRPRLTLALTATSLNLPEHYVVIFPATGPYSSARTWPAERFAAVASALRERGWPIVIAGASDASLAATVIRKSIPDALDLTAQTSLPELASLVGGSALAIGGDTFIGHLAAALNRSVVSIFGPSNHAAWRPFGSVLAESVSNVTPPGIIVRHDLPCEPCIYTGYSLGRPSGCPARTCLTMVTVDNVVDAALRLLEAD
jgi:ADP-heptose:LPS heptosyltransferase